MAGCLSRLIAELYLSERFMKICILLLAIALLAGCENVQPPTNEQVKKVADLCEKKGLTVELFYNGTATRVSCNQP